MRFAQLADFSAFIASQARGIIESPHPIDETRLGECWRTGRDWLIGLLHQIDHGFETDESQPLCKLPQNWARRGNWMKQVFAAEMLLRVWGAVLTARDHSFPQEGSKKVARHILILQLKTRQRVLRLLLDGSQKPPAELCEVDRFRRKVERWTDLLLGEMVLRYEVNDFAFDSRRARNFGVDYFQNQHEGVCNFTWQLLGAGLKSSFHTTIAGDDETDDLPQNFACAILACLPHDTFHENGPNHSLRMTRMKRNACKFDAPPHGGLPRLFERPGDCLPHMQHSAWSLRYAKLRRKPR